MQEISRSLRSFLEPYAILIRKAGAEFFGTFMIVFAGAAASIVNHKYDGVETLLGNAACSGLAVVVAVFATGHISKAHLNPSVTIAFAAFRHFPWSEVPFYIMAQVLASISASFALKGIFHPFMNGGVTVPSVGDGQAFALEFVVTFNLMFIITAVATDSRAVGDLAGVAIGATVFFDILIAGPVTGASMNPVRTLGPAIAAGHYKSLWIYLVAPTLGALAGAAAYTAVKLPEIPNKTPNATMPPIGSSGDKRAENCCQITCRLISHSDEDGALSSETDSHPTTVLNNCTLNVPGYEHLRTLCC